MTAVLFDLDDTLLDYSGRVAECRAAACAGAVEARLDRAGRGPTSGAAAARVVRMLAERGPGGRYSGSAGAIDVVSSVAAGRATM